MAETSKPQNLKTSKPVGHLRQDASGTLVSLYKEIPYNATPQFAKFSQQ